MDPHDSNSNSYSKTSHVAPFLAISKSGWQPNRLKIYYVRLQTDGIQRRKLDYFFANTRTFFLFFNEDDAMEGWGCLVIYREDFLVKFPLTFTNSLPKGSKKMWLDLGKLIVTLIDLDYSSFSISVSSTQI